MNALQVLRALGPVDLRSVRRDPLLRWMIFYPLLVAGLIRWGTPRLSDFLMARYGFDLAPYHLLLMSFVLLMTPMLAGMVIGFLLLDQRDDQTLTALSVTPLTLDGYLIYRISLPMALSVALTFVLFPLAGLLEVAKIGLGPLLLAALSAAPLGPLYALTLAGLAANKVQGFALTKALGVLLVFPVAAWFVPEPWQWAFGLVPLYWPAKLLWLLAASAPDWWVCLLLGLGWQALLLAVLLRRFKSGGGSPE